MIDVDVRVALGAVADQLGAVARNLEADRRRQEDQIPRSIDFKANLSFPASGNGLLVPNVSGPPAGYLWHVRQLFFTGSSGPAAATPAGTGFVYVGSSPQLAAQADLSAAFQDRTSTAFPVAGFYSQWELVVRYPEAIYAIIVGGASATDYTFGGRAEQVVDVARAPEVYGL